MTQTGFERLPKKWPSENWQDAWVPGVKADGILYISGITSSDPDGMPVGVGDFEKQARRCIEKLKDVVGRAGGSLADIVKLNTFLTPEVKHEDLKKYFDVRKEFFGNAFPASTGVTVHSLLKKEYMIEIDAIAHLRKA